MILFQTYISKMFPCSNILNINNNKNKLISKIEFNTCLTIIVPKKLIKNVLLFLKLHTNTQYNLITDITAIDYLNNKNRFILVYNLLSIRYNIRLLIKLETSEIDIIESVTTIFKGACWYEREIWDLFGIIFILNPDLRRLLTDYGFQYHPLRKDFPLIGFTELYYLDIYGKFLKTKIINKQRFKIVKNLNNWETSIL